jgi:phosphoribosylanthranilate isomerase
MPVQIKICGFKEPDSLRAAAAIGVDWAGFNFFPKSPRYVTPEVAQNLLLHVGDTVPVALLVDPADTEIDTICALGFPVLQLHGQESPSRIAQIKARTGLEIWKAVGIASAEDLETARYYTAADRLLLDAKAPRSALNSGGHGVTFDWSLLAAFTADKRGTPDWILAGGLTPGNVAEAISRTGAPAVDVSSGVERVRGLKNADLIKQFVGAAQQS